MSKEKYVAMIQGMGKIDDAIKKMLVSRLKAEEEIKKHCKEDGHLWFCSCISPEYDTDSEFLGKTYYFKCLVCQEVKTKFYNKYCIRNIDDIYECHYFAEIFNALIKNDITYANELLKTKEAEFGLSPEKLRYMSDILNQVGYTIDIENITIISN